MALKNLSPAEALKANRNGWGDTAVRRNILLIPILYGNYAIYNITIVADSICLLRGE